ncbi:MAG TPA: hypothetical protein VML55_15170, partial [Planctomycetaceae bacterium]|nr:hypothetical protein [Planctomycetaceae bacterium]
MTTRRRRKAPAYELHRGRGAPLHPEWLDDRVPNGFWTDPANHRRYMLWLGRQLGFRRWEDWYQIRVRDFDEHHGETLLGYYGGCAVRAVVANFPEHVWQEWLFAFVPHGFWNDPANRRRYMQWLGDRLGFSRPEDWYRIKHRHFTQNHGGGFLTTAYNGSSIAAVKEYLPDYDWKEWLFDWAGPNFWSSPDNRRRYMEWLGEQLGYRRPEDWYQITLAVIHARSGGGLARRYHNSPAALVMDCFPEYDWRPESFRGTRPSVRAAL